MNKFFSGGLILASFFLCVNSALAETTPNLYRRLGSAGKESGLFSGAPVDLTATIGNIIAIFLSFLGAVGLILVIYAGWLWFTAGGSEEKVEKAKTLLKNAVIGFVIITLAYAITEFVVRSIVGGTVTGGSPVDSGGSSGTSIPNARPQ